MGEKDKRADTPAAPGSAAADASGHLQEAGLDRLTPESVAKMLRERGIDDLQQLVAQVVKKAKGSVARPINLYAPLPAPSPEVARSTVHRPPEIPVDIDGTVYDPHDITRFNGQVIHFLYTQNDMGEPMLHGFTGTEWTRAMHTYFQIRHMISAFDVGPHPLDLFPPTPPSPFALPPYPAPSGWPSWPPNPWTPSPWPPIFPLGPSAPAPPPPPPPPEAKFHEHADFGGDWLWLGARREHNDLTEVGRGFLHMGDWNDIISSLDTSNFTIVLYEHINFGGTGISFPPRTRIANLSTVGWNDRASSIKNLG